jgi:hypothetical protein
MHFLCGAGAGCLHPELRTFPAGMSDIVHLFCSAGCSISNLSLFVQALKMSLRQAAASTAPPQ